MSMDQDDSSFEDGFASVMDPDYQPTPAPAQAEADGDAGEGDASGAAGASAADAGATGEESPGATSADTDAASARSIAGSASDAIIISRDDPRPPNAVPTSMPASARVKRAVPSSATMAMRSADQENTRPVA